MDKEAGMGSGEAAGRKRQAGKIISTLRFFCEPLLEREGMRFIAKSQIRGQLPGFEGHRVNNLND